MKVKGIVVGWACVAVAVACIVLSVLQIRHLIIRTVIEIPVGDFRYGLKVAPALFFLVSCVAVFFAAKFSAEMLGRADDQTAVTPQDVLEDDTQRVRRPAPN